MIQIVLIIIIILITVLHLWWKPQKMREGFRATMSREVRGMLPVSTARLADVHPIQEDNPLDLPWIASWSAADRNARYGQTCQVLYTEDGPCDTVIQTVSASCESGMPHTRTGDRIILPESIQLPDREEIVRHELVHILQRRFSDNWLAFYRRNWLFTFAPAAPQGMPQTVLEARRSNPDTWEHPWVCWMNRWWPVAVYRDSENPQLRDAQTVWWDAAVGVILEDPPADWTAFFGHPSQDEHPHELSATMLVANDTASEAGRRLQNWWRSEGRRTQISTDSICPL